MDVAVSGGSGRLQFLPSWPSMAAASSSDPAADAQPAAMLHIFKFKFEIQISNFEFEFECEVRRQHAVVPGRPLKCGCWMSDPYIKLGSLAHSLSWMCRGAPPSCGGRSWTWV